jgi:glutaredoxin
VIKIYGVASCGTCETAKKKCQEFGVEYEYYDIVYRRYYLEAVEANADMTKIPHIIVDGEYIGDYKNLLSFLRGVRYGIKGI